MLNIRVVYDNEQDKELLNLMDTTVPFFVDYINMHSSEGRKTGFKLLNYWSATKLPFVVVEDFPKVFYSEIGENAINQLLKWLNENSSNQQGEATSSEI